MFIRDTLNEQDLRLKKSKKKKNFKMDDESVCLEEANKILIKGNFINYGKGIAFSRLITKYLFTF